MMPSYRQKAKVPYVIGIEGEGLGSCKSLTLVYFCKLAHLAGYTVYTNMETLNVPHHNFYEDILPNLQDYNTGAIPMPRHAFYALDDINKLSESRSAMNPVSINLSHFMQDVRKAESSFAYTIPILLWTDVRFYDVTDLVIDAAYDEISSTVFWTMWDPYLTKMAGRRVVVGRVQGNARALFGLYDSWEKIKRPTNVQLFGEEHAKEVSEFACKGCGSTQVRTNRDGTRHCVRCGVSWKIKPHKVKA